MATKNQRSRSKTRSTSKSRSRSDSMSPSGPNEPLTKAQFQEQLGANKDFAEEVNESLLKHFSHYFSKVTNYQKEMYEKKYGNLEGMITNEDLTPFNISNADFYIV